MIVAGTTSSTPPTRAPAKSFKDELRAA
jgi:hypothetical protein